MRTNSLNRKNEKWGMKGLVSGDIFWRCPFKGLLARFFFLCLFVCCILTTGCLWRLSSCAVCSSLACLLRLQCPSNSNEWWNGCLLQSFVVLAAQAFPCCWFRLERRCAYIAKNHSVFSAGIVFWNSTQNNPENAWAGAVTCEIVAAVR